MFSTYVYVWLVLLCLYKDTHKDSAMKISLDMVASMRLLVSVRITALNFNASRAYQWRQKNELTVRVRVQW